MAITGPSVVPHVCVSPATNHQPLRSSVPVGDSTPSLLSILREVHLLESATHANITRYHHAWLETSPSRSAFAPPVPTLHILMEFANGGSLQGFVDARRGTSAPGADEGGRERARRARREGRQRAVHLLRVEDVVTLFRDVAEGLAFLHGRNILHLDLKARRALPCPAVRECE